MSPGATRQRQPSLRKRLLVILLIPVLLVLLLAALLEYGLATEYSNRVHDRDLSDTALTLGEMMSNDSLDGTLSAQASFLLEYDPEGRNYYTVDSKQHGHLIGNADLHPTTEPLVIGHAPVLYDTARRGRRPRHRW